MDNNNTHLSRLLALFLGLITLLSISTQTYAVECKKYFTGGGNTARNNFCSSLYGSGSYMAGSASGPDFDYSYCKTSNGTTINSSVHTCYVRTANSDGVHCPEGYEENSFGQCTLKLDPPDPDPITDENKNGVEDSTEPPAPDISTCDAEYIAFSPDDVIGETTKTAPDGCQYVPSSEGPYICEYNTFGEVQQCYAPAVPVGTVPPPSGTSCNSLYCVQPNEQAEFQPTEEIEIYMGTSPNPQHPQDYEPSSNGGTNEYPSTGGGDTGGGDTGGGDTGGGDTGGGDTGGGSTGGGSTGGGSTGGGSTGGGDTGGGDGDGDGNDEETSLFCEYAPIMCTLADWFMDDSDLPEDEETPFEEVEQPDSWQITGQTYCPQNFNIEIMQGKGTTLVWEPYCELGALMKPFILAVSIFASGMILLGVKS